ncbi:hypothetical protein PM082_020964 [Marasmius tenuissimus]|nr:hypothetical protein PM082_020964 [Marasmius tenuissimus]
MPFIDTGGLLLFARFSNGVSSSSCNHINDITRWMHIFGATLSEVVLTVRAYAVSRYLLRRNPLIPLVFLSGVCWLAAYLITTDKFGKLPQPRGPMSAMHLSHERTRNGCVNHVKNSLSFVIYICIAVHEIGILTVMVIAGYSTYKRREYSKVFYVAYRDGVLYYILLIAALACNAIMLCTAPTNFSMLFMPMTRVIHSILTSHTVLHLREVVNTRDLNPEDWELPAITFASNFEAENSDTRFEEEMVDHGAVRIE